MRLRISILALLTGSSICQAIGPETILHFDPAFVELLGTVETQTFPGPPGYESIKQGDEMEPGWYLRLKEPVTVEANKPATTLGWQTEKHVRVLQMAIDWDQTRESKLAVGKTIKVKGKLFNRQNGHHHSRVLIDVSELSEVHE